ncbi:hypothetical protein F2Q69_00061757 [Brassica cretica]|uniref:NYN domain-containing protein n=1 Tax=Brassica cretica TaxID=69181 RepID=A0A8S9RDF8_BRACR|nr:hypothetical protein F2Q69_00061757 [Brassica cretica]
MATLDHNLMPIPFYAFKTVYVAWYIENCAVPRGLPACTVLERIRRSLRNQGYEGDIRILAVAANQDRVPQHIQDALLNNGVEYYDLHTNVKQASDDEIVKRIREKMGCTDRGNFMLISGDGGFEEVVRELETEGHNTILAYNLESAAEAIQYKEQERKLSEVEPENRNMKVELEEFRAEATHLKNHQPTIRRLEERNRQLEQQMEENTKEVVEIKQRNQNTLDLVKDREQALQGTSTVRLSYKQLMKILRTRIARRCRREIVPDEKLLQQAKTTANPDLPVVEDTANAAQFPSFPPKPPDPADTNPSEPISPIAAPQPFNPLDDPPDSKRLELISEVKDAPKVAKAPRLKNKKLLRKFSCEEVYDRMSKRLWTSTVRLSYKQLMKILRTRIARRCRREIVPDEKLLQQAKTTANPDLPVVEDTANAAQFPSFPPKPPDPADTNPSEPISPIAAPQPFNPLDDPPDSKRLELISEVKDAPKVAKAPRLKNKKLLRKFSCEEVYDRMSKRLCAFSEEVDIPGHHLKHKGVTILVTDKDDEPILEDTLVEPYEPVTNTAMKHDSFSKSLECFTSALQIVDVAVQREHQDESNEHEKMSLCLGENIKHMIGSQSQKAKLQSQIRDRPMRRLHIQHKELHLEFQDMPRLLVGASEFGAKIHKPPVRNKKLLGDETLGKFRGGKSLWLM